ncbi:MAG TPA: Ig-like domain-containing protein [Gaiellaceae bacterium]|nr:Ig-like domain-containing protein [Gaiellaceae bacterium]
MALLCVLVLIGAGWVGAVALAASGPPAPSLSESPNASPTSSTSITFTYGDSQSGVTFSCTLDGAAKSCGGTTSGTTTFTSLSQGSHTFQIQAVSGGKSSAATSYTWTVDTTAPTVFPPALAGSSPTSATSVSWTVTFSEAVRNVVAGDFQLGQTTNLSGAAITGLSGSGASYTVTAATGSLVNPGSNGTLRLDMTSKTAGGTITDLAGNPLSTTMPVTGASYTVDRNPPPAPSIDSGPSSGSLTNSSSASFGFSDGEAAATFLCKLDSGSFTACSSPASYSGLADGSHTFTVEAKDAAGNVSTGNPSRTWTVDTTPPPKPSIVGPNNKSDSTSATFTITDSEANVSYMCRLDGSGWTPCTSPKTYTLLSPGTHVFDAEPIDQAGNIGPYNEWKWTINGLSGSGQPFTISINGSLAKLYPGGATDKIDLALHNPNSAAIYVYSLTVTLSSITKATGVTQPCTAGDFTLTQLGAGANLSSNPIMVPAGGTVTLTGAGLGAYLPTIRMNDNHVAQDGCKNATLNFTFGGSAQS